MHSDRALKKVGLIRSSSRVPHLTQVPAFSTSIKVVSVSGSYVLYNWSPFEDGVSKLLACVFYREDVVTALPYLVQTFTNSSIEQCGAVKFQHCSQSHCQQLSLEDGGKDGRKQQAGFSAHLPDFSLQLLLNMPELHLPVPPLPAQEQLLADGKLTSCSFPGVDKSRVVSGFRQSEQALGAKTMVWSGLVAGGQQIQSSCTPEVVIALASVTEVFLERHRFFTSLTKVSGQPESAKDFNSHMDAQVLYDSDEASTASKEFLCLTASVLLKVTEPLIIIRRCILRRKDIICKQMILKTKDRRNLMLLATTGDTAEHAADAKICMGLPGGEAITVSAPRSSKQLHDHLDTWGEGTKLRDIPQTQSA
ncbi:hypothetical protein Anapl_17079 [Anas platyrhynchos]|uniref:Uncharacterized protein n=1 Tax=Anas platyrhynchos TaxID=8839 RepID=R0LD11_ANAPL|nr:hypothetical protein Anapl_17079 [Anas platyrhynchos]